MRSGSAERFLWRHVRFRRGDIAGSGFAGIAQFTGVTPEDPVASHANNDHAKHNAYADDESVRLPDNLDPTRAARHVG
jgi:hypothetical protein